VAKKIDWARRELQWNKQMAKLMSHPDWEVDPYGCMISTVKRAIEEALKYQGSIGRGPEWNLAKKLDKLTKGA
jgi:hypothetical protein